MKKIKLTQDLVEAISKCACPKCGHKLNGRTQIGDSLDGFDVYNEMGHATPAKDDVSICFHCGAKLVFIDGGDGFLRCRLMTEEELNSMPERVREALELPIREMVERLSAFEEGAKRDENDFVTKWLH